MTLVVVVVVVLVLLEPGQVAVGFGMWVAPPARALQKCFAKMGAAAAAPVGDLFAVQIEAAE